MPAEFQTIIDDTLHAHAQLLRRVGDPAKKMAAFQWPWDIARAGAQHLQNHGSAVGALANGGGQVMQSAQGASILNAVSSGPTNSANTDKMLNDGLFSGALNQVKADQLLRTVFIGWSSGAQVGLLGGGGGTGVAYDIVSRADARAVGFGAFDVGLGVQIGAGLLLGAMTAPPSGLNYSTNVWQFGASFAVSVLVTVIMNSSDLSLIGFALNLGGGAGASSSVGYGSISTQ